MENLPTTINLDDERTLSTIRQTIAYDATGPEFDMFVQFCKSTGLNPFKKEIWFIKTKGYTNKHGTKVEGKVQIMTGINGFYTIANNHPQYDGMEEVEFGENDKGEIIWAKAKVWRKDRRFPSVGTADWAEFFPGTTDKGQSLWEKKPRVMLAKVAESIALRKAFPQELNGMYTAEEMPPEFVRPYEGVKPDKKLIDEKVVIHIEETVDPDTGEIRVKEVDPSASTELETIPDRRNIQWDKYKYKYRLPLKSTETLDIPALRTALKENGAQWRPRVTKNKESGIKYKVEGGDDCWYSNTTFPELAEFCQFNSDQEITIHNDELPDSMGAV